jgi:hypothetical protein
VLKKLENYNFSDLKKETKSISKDILEGESCEITGHLVNSENNMGRSTVIDLNAPHHNNFR